MSLTSRIDPSEPKFAPLPSTAEMRLLDQKTIDSGTPSLELMERAGRAVAGSASGFLKNSGGRKVLIACGPGNNGGDGLVAARLLAKDGFEVLAVLAGAKKFSKDYLENLDRALNAGIKINALLLGEDQSPSPKIEAAVNEEIFREAASAALVIDAVLGTGQESAPRGSVGGLTKIIAETDPRKVLSVDIPTGINADTGEVYEPHISAGHTVCIQFIKRGLVQYPAHEFCGDISCVDIGIGPKAEIEFSFNAAEAPGFPIRTGDTHKNKQGSVLVIGGSKAMPGAPLLSSRAALRAGAGLVDKVHLQSEEFDPAVPEVMLLRVKGGKEDTLSGADAPDVIERLGRSSAVVIGPGLGRNKDTAEFFSRLLPEILRAGLPCVIDADGLNLLAELGLRTPLSNCVLTPHPKEMSRLLSSSVEEVQNNRFLAASRLSKMYDCAVVLKGPFSIVYSANRGWVNTTGNPYLATAGSGDVLAGIIAGIAAQGMEVGDAARLGCLLHGLSADILVKKRAAPLVAGDIIESLPDAIAAYSA